MAVEGRSSISASSLTSSSGRRTSSSSFQPPPLPPPISARRASSSSSFQLPPLPPSSESLAAGTSIPAPVYSVPTPPPKDFKTAQMSLPVPVTPQRKPVLRQKSPLSNEAYFSSPAPSMPGSFPASSPPTTSGTSPKAGPQNAQFSATAYAASDSPSPSSKSPRRPNNFKNLLSFKALRKSYDKASPDSSGIRPPSSGGDSTLSSGRPSLNKKKSGSFWRRTSSLGMSFGSEGENGYQNPIPEMKHGSVPEEGASIRSPTPTPNEFPTMKKRKSGTFWRRRSSMGLATAFGPNGSTKEGANGTMNGAANASTNGEYSDSNGNHKDMAVGGREIEKQLPDLPLSPLSPASQTNFEEEMLPRSYSPPPQLPEFVGAGGGLGGDDLFKDIR